MARRRRSTTHSPGRWNFLGLFLLVMAIGAGMAAGIYLGRQSGREVWAPAVPAPDSQAPTGTVEPRAALEPSPPRLPEAAQEDSPAKPPPDPEAQAQSGGATSQEAPAASPPEEPKPVARGQRPPIGYPGEIAHVSGAGGKVVALTFDAGASATPTPALLKVLRDHGLRVTFFLTGKWCEANEALVRQIASEGHEVANHTYAHKDLRKLTDAQIASELGKLDEIVVRLTGRTTKPYFRAPYGGRDSRVLRTAAQEGYRSVYWAVDSWDAFKKGITDEEIRKRVLGRIQAGDIVLMHCGSQATVSALPELISEVERRGYRIVTVSELAGP